MNFNDTIENLKIETNNIIAAECLEIMTNEEVLFNEGFIQNKNKLSSLYNHRLKMAKEISENNFEKEEIENWQVAVNCLNQSTSDKLELNWIDSGHKRYMLFWDAQTKKLEAIFFLYSKKSILEQEKFNDMIIEKGHSVNSVKFKKGKRIKDWEKSA